MREQPGEKIQIKRQLQRERLEKKRAIQKNYDSRNPHN